MDNEQDKLEQEVKLGEHAEEIKTKLAQLNGILNESEQSALVMISEAKVIFSSVASFSESFQALFKRLESLRVELTDIVYELGQAGENIDYDPIRIRELSGRLDMIYRLMKKHNVNSIPDLLQIQESLERVSLKTKNLDVEIDRAKNDLEMALASLRTAGELLSNSRKKNQMAIANQLVKHLQSLGIPQAAVTISHETIAPTATGIDRMEINFSANKGVSPRPLAEVASGGEFSRLMFSIKYIMAEKSALPTLVLDEIDSGVSGEIAVSLGKMMKQMAKSHQIIAISHLPQIAAKADLHFVVYKDNKAAQSVSLIKKLEPSGRVEEIAKMIGGAKPTPIALENAKELIDS
jgi:DNA repair protein RecN (Recombination protein N)